MGIDVPVMILVLFAIGCALPAAAGMLIGPINYVEVSMGIGGLLVGIVESLGAGYRSGNFKNIYAFALLIAVLMVRPSGLLGATVKVKA
jgi:branched-chain amino acid transport system permease protein